MKECPKCKNKLLDSAKFCMKCGYNLKKHEEENSKYFCPECGTQFSGGHFCPECGYDISKDINKKTPKKLNSDIDLSQIDKLLDDKINKSKEEKSLSYFEYEKYLTGGYIIKKYIDPIETDVNLPNNIVGIKDNAFAGTSVIAVKLNSGLKFIGKRAFADCKFLEKLIIPQTVNRIDDEAFINCSKLDVVIPKTVEIKGSNLIKNTLGEILAIEKEKQEQALREKKEREEALRKENERLRKEEEKRKAEEKAALEKRLKEEAEKERIRKEQEIARKKIEAEQERIRKEQEIARKKLEAEQEKKRLEEEKLKKQLAEISKRYKFKGNEIIKYIGRQKNVVIPDFFTEINIEAFKDNKFIETIVINDNIKVIPSGCFQHSKYLRKVQLGPNVTTIGDNAFASCDVLQEINIPDTLSRIGENAFYGCESLKRIDIPRNVVYLGRRAFYNCKALEEVSLLGNLKSVYAETFMDCSSLKEIAFKDGLINIEAKAFYRCKSLEKVFLPNSVMQINQEAFSNCESLSDINVPNQLIGLTYKVFCDCKKLKSFELPNSIKEISSFSLSGTSITNLHIPSSVEKIENNSINMDTLETISVDEKNRNFFVKDNILYEHLTKTDTKLKLIPSNYKVEKIKLPEDLYVRYIVSGSVKNKHIKEFDCSNTVYVIEQYAFSNCDGLTSIKGTKNIKSIGLKAIFNCVNLTEIDYFENLTSFNTSAIYGCSKLKKIYLYLFCKVIKEHSRKYKIRRKFSRGK